jgi:hypothetical protein
MKRRALVLLALLSALAVPGCRRGSDGPQFETSSPKAAASQLERAFAGAKPELAEQAKAAAAALEAGAYQQAVTSLQAIREQENLTLEQGLAIHGSVVTMEGKLIEAIQAGDPNARQAYELLKALKRN